MSDDISGATSDESAGPWLSPSEALTRFIPREQTPTPAMRDAAPKRFGFRVGNIGLLVPAEMHSELAEKIEIYPLPTTPVWFPGLMNLRGGLVPVFDLKKLFNMEDPGGETRNLLVLNAGEEAVGVLSDGLPLSLDASRRVEQTPPLPEILQKHCYAVYVRDHEIWVDLDFDGLFRAAGRRIAA